MRPSAGHDKLHVSRPYQQAQTSYTCPDTFWHPRPVPAVHGRQQEPDEDRADSGRSHDNYVFMIF